MSADGDIENYHRRQGSDKGGGTHASAPEETASEAVDGLDQGAENRGLHGQVPESRATGAQKAQDALSQEAPAQKSQTQPAGGAAASHGVLPNKAAEDDPRRWGDQPGSYDHDAWLREQRPPHWG